MLLPILVKACQVFQFHSQLSQSFSARLQQLFVTKFQCIIATIVNLFPAPQFFSGKMCPLWLLDSLNVIELTVVNGSSENFQNVDNKQTSERTIKELYLLMLWTNSTTNLFESEYFWTGADFWSDLDSQSVFYNKSQLSSNFAVMLWELVYEWTGTHALGNASLVSAAPPQH